MNKGKIKQKHINAFLNVTNCLLQIVMLAFLCACQESHTDEPSQSYEGLAPFCLTSPYSYDNLIAASYNRDSVLCIGLKSDTLLEYSQFFHDSMTIFTRLEGISIRWCYLTSLPNNLYTVRTLKSIEIFSTDGFRYLSDSIALLKSLSSLEICGANLPEIPDSIGGASSLESVILKRDRINIFPEGITNCSELKYLLLNDNQITTLPETIKKLKKLEFLDLSGNPIPHSMILLLRKWLPNTKIYPM